MHFAIEPILLISAGYISQQNRYVMVRAKKCKRLQLREHQISVQLTITIRRKYKILNAVRNAKKGYNYLELVFIFEVILFSLFLSIQKRAFHPGLSSRNVVTW